MDENNIDFRIWVVVNFGVGNPEFRFTMLAGWRPEVGFRAVLLHWRLPCVEA
ncbi:hypothetical protein M7I_3208 [Glarea lozoyensis 74030]|uniref:Uncharacterized protein n=1 Tax=Glarea lozoyensis (strain ATCC 74030 / MF5533) TaxID=1104152 RepID=H0EKX4_GLAL7|nr:hypothetical protein M7I_3208 [Glarea lozoyensis 74030]